MYEHIFLHKHLFRKFFTIDLFISVSPYIHRKMEYKLFVYMYKRKLIVLCYLLLLLLILSLKDLRYSFF